MFFISARSHRDLREITNLAEFLATSLLSRRKLFHIGVISFVSQKYLSSRRDLVSISPEITFISCRCQRYYKSRRVLDEISARSRLYRRDRRHYQSRRVIGEISAKSRLSHRDLRDITNIAELSSRFR